jgi:GH25 family lysozyme M1 (1,4-beta-N-acetylmuramidase)
MCVAAAIPIALTAFAAYKGAKADKAAATWQAQVAGANVATSQALAVDAVARGDNAAAGTVRRGNQLQGRQRAVMAARGVDLTQGSPLEILRDTQYFTDIDAATVRSNAAREAWGYKAQATNYQNQAIFAQSRADQTNPLMSAGLAAAGSFFGGGGKFSLGDYQTVAPKWYGTVGHSGYGGGGYIGGGA